MNFRQFQSSIARADQPSGFEFAHSFTAVVDTPITARSPGRVMYEASYWPAKLVEATAASGQTAAVTLNAGQMVTVVGRQGITLMVTDSTLP